jgi:hypothetical protein
MDFAITEQTTTKLPYTVNLQFLHRAPSAGKTLWAAVPQNLPVRYPSSVKQVVGIFSASHH